MHFLAASFGNVYAVRFDIEADGIRTLMSKNTWENWRQAYKLVRSPDHSNSPPMPPLLLYVYPADHTSEPLSVGNRNSLNTDGP